MNDRTNTAKAGSRALARRRKRTAEVTPDVAFGKAYDHELARRLWVFVRPHKKLFTIALISYPITSAFQLIQPYMVKVAIDEHVVPGKLEGFGWIVAIFTLLVAMEFVARYYQTLLTQLLGQRVTKDLRVALFRKLQVVDLAYLERNPVGRLMTRVTNDVESIAEMFSAGAVSILGDLVTLTGIIVMMLILDWRLTLSAFLVLPVLLTVVLISRKYARQAFRDIRTQLARINGFLNEAISGMGVVQAFRQERAMRDEFEEINTAYRNANFQAILYDALTYAIVEGVGTIAIALTLYFGIGLYQNNLVEIGLFVAFVDYLRRFFAPITELSTKFTILQSAMASAERCVELLDQHPVVVDPPAPKTAPEPATVPRDVPALRFDDVSFKYGTEGAAILDHISFTVKRGEKIALVGPTGSGKSTIVKLISRFYDPSSGSVRLDGMDLKELSLEGLRARLALVLQDPYLFDGTIRENVAFGTFDAPQPVLEAAAQRTQALEIITARGWDAPVGDRGSRFSAGERQLIAFARALASNPELLILDEATSSVDPETEGRIQKALEELIRDRTAVIIAHRLSTIRRVDRILVLARGRIIEEGSHDELFERGGLYRTLYELQFADPDHEPAAVIA